MDKKSIRQQELLPFGGITGLITKHFYGALSKTIEGIGIDRHYTTLLIIGRTVDKCTQQYLSDLVEVDKVSMVRILDYHVGRGMIKRTVNPDDRREHLITLTAKGKANVARIEKGISDLNKIAFKGFIKKEQELLTLYLARVIANLNHIPGDAVDIKIKKKRK